jgi:hypothetical protein
MTKKNKPQLNRRDFVISTAGAAVTATGWTARAIAEVNASWAQYDDAIIIDFLGSPGYFN